MHINIDAPKMAEMNELLGTPVKSQSTVSTGNQEQSTPRRSPRLRVASRSNYEDISPIKDVQDDDHVSSCTGRWDGTFIGSSSVLLDLDDQQHDNSAHAPQSHESSAYRYTNYQMAKIDTCLNTYRNEEGHQ